jgi:hypothetical protein
MVQILHVNLNKIHQLISYAFSEEKIKLVFFPQFFQRFKGAKKNLTRGVQQSGY